MKKTISILLTVMLVVCFNSSAMSMEKTSNSHTPEIVLINGVQENVYLSTEKTLNTNHDFTQSQKFIFTDSRTIIWDNIPSDTIFSYLYVQIFKHQQLTAENCLHNESYEKPNRDKTSYEMPLPVLDDGAYTFVFYAREKRFTDPYIQYRMMVVVMNGKYYFAELPLAPDSALANKLKKRAEDYLSDKEYMGISIGIVKDGQVLFLNYGYTENGGDNITEHSIFEIGSITKTFTATIIADLEKQGLLSLDDSLKKYLGFPVALNGTDIKLIDLLTHTSGLPRAISTRSDLDTLLEYLKTVELAAKPGTTYEYSNTGFAVLGHIIEQVSGKTYEEAVHEHILDKLEMTNTSAYLSTEQEQRRALPHSEKGKAVSICTFDPAWTAVGFLKSSTYDMTKYVMANLGQTPQADVQLQNAITLAQTKHRTSMYKDSVVMNMGLSWMYDRNIYGTNNPIVMHSGGTVGYTSSLILSHHLNTGIIILCNDDAIYNGVTNGINVSMLGYHLLNAVRDSQ